MNQPAGDRSLRSVFVGNIPYDASEEKLREIFQAVGPVLSFRIVFDRDTGKPKGYGFCEFKDQETAASAIRNLNGHDIGGRQLRVDSASNDKNRDDQPIPASSNQPQQPLLLQPQQKDMQQQIQIPQVIQPTEPLVDPKTQIDSVIQTMSPDMLFEICKQMKSSLLVNPNETRNMLLQNPQVCYALLQVLVSTNALDQVSCLNFFHAPLQQMPIYPTMPFFAPANQAMNQAMNPPFR